MKKIAFKLIIAVAALIGGVACTEEVGNPTFGADELYVYDNKATAQSVEVGETLLLEMMVSPNDGSVDCRWLLDGTVISSQKDLSYVGQTAGIFPLRFEATKGQHKVIKTYTLTIVE